MAYGESMKTVTINLTYIGEVSEFDPTTNSYKPVEKFIVNKVTNSLNPVVGSRLKKDEVQTLIETPYHVVNIMETKKR